MYTKNMAAIFLLTYLFIFFTSSVNGIAVMSVDFGSEWMKVAIVSPGVPMEIALNKESKRKTLSLISFRDGERTFGEDAQTIGIRFPHNSFPYLLDLLGKSIDNPVVKLYKQRFPYHNIVEDPERNTILFRIDENTSYTPEELIAQILHKAKEIAETAANQKINEAVITVPGFFNQIERLALLQAAKLANIKVLQLMNDYSAVALNYGIFRRKDINDTPQYIMFYDMGASSTSASIVSYQNVKIKDRGSVEVHPQFSVLGVGYDRTLGGLEIQTRLQNYLGKKFDEVNKSPNSVFKNNRAIAKLQKEAGRVKNVLSVNTEHYAQIEGLLDEQDFKLQVTRETFEDLCQDLFDRVHVPIETALNTAGLSIDQISSVVLVGGGTRVPKIQEKISAYVKKELSKNINADEAAALGAVYKAADLSQGFKVKKFLTKDAVLFPIQIVFSRISEDKNKQVKKMLFSRMNSYPQKKIITFNKHNQDFSFDVNYAELEYLPKEEVLAIGNTSLSTIFLSGVADALEKSKEDGSESKGIKAHFQMDDSGILNLLNVEHVSEKVVVPDEESDGAFSKLGSTISKLFSSSDEKKVNETTKEDIKPEEEVPPKMENDTANATESKNGTSTDSSTKGAKNATDSTETNTKPEMVTVKKIIPASEVKLGPQLLSEDNLKLLQDRIAALDRFDQEKQKREKALNSLESFVIDTQMKLDSDEYRSFMVPDQSNELTKAFSDVSEWLYEDGIDASADVYEDKLKNLKKLTNDINNRMFEYKERPEVLNRLTMMLNDSRHFLANIENFNATDSIFTPTEIKTLENVINETQSYLDDFNKEVSEKPLYETITYTVRETVNKMGILDREVKYLINKIKIWNPAPKVKEDTSETADNTNKTEKNKSETPKDKQKQSDNTNKTEKNESETPKDKQEQSDESVTIESDTETSKAETEEEKKHEEL